MDIQKTVLKENKAMQQQLKKKLQKLEKKLRKRLPNYCKEQLDSMVLALKEKPELVKDSIKTLIKDSVAQTLTEMQMRLKEELEKNPSQLEEHPEIQKTIDQLEALKGYRTLLKKEGLKEVIKPKEMLQMTDQFKALDSAFKEYSSLFKDWDQALMDKVTSLDEVKKFQEELELAKLYKLPEGYRNQMNQIQSNEFIQEQLQEKAEGLAKVGGATLQERLDQAMDKVEEAKAKFPDLKSLADAPKRYNPHKEEPFLQRIDIGGNFQINRQRPVSVDLALQVNYPLNSNLLLGFSGATRLFFEKKDFNNIQPQGGNGLRSFVRAKLFGSLSAQANFERNQIEIQNSTDQTINNSWVNTSLLGINTIKLKENLSLEISLLYDLFYNSIRSPNNGRWVSRIGFILN